MFKRGLWFDYVNIHVTKKYNIHYKKTKRFHQQNYKFHLHLSSNRYSFNLETVQILHWFWGGNDIHVFYDLTGFRFRTSSQHAYSSCISLCIVARSFWVLNLRKYIRFIIQYYL